MLLTFTTLSPSLRFFCVWSLGVTLLVETTLGCSWITSQTGKIKHEALHTPLGASTRSKLRHTPPSRTQLCYRLRMMTTGWCLESGAPKAVWGFRCLFTETNPHLGQEQLVWDGNDNKLGRQTSGAFLYCNFCIRRFSTCGIWTRWLTSTR